MSSSQKYCAKERATLQERLASFVQEKLESEENAAGKAPSAQHPAPDIPLDEVAAELDKRVAERDEVVAQLKGEISILKKAAAQRDERVAELDEVAAERDQRAAERDEVVAQLEGEISSLREAAAERDKRVAERDEVVAWREGEIGTLRQAVANREAVMARRVLVTTRAIPWPGARNCPRMAAMDERFLEHLPLIGQRRARPQNLVQTTMTLLAIIGKSLAGGIVAGAIVFAGIIFAGLYLSAANLAHLDGFLAGSSLGPYASVIGTFLVGLCQIRRAGTLPTWGIVSYGLFLLLWLFLIYAGYPLVF